MYLTGAQLKQIASSVELSLVLLTFVVYAGSEMRVIRCLVNQNTYGVGM